MPIDWNRVLDVFIAQLPLLVTAIFTGFIGLRKLNKIGEQTDGLTDALVKKATALGEAKATIATADGHAQGVADQKAEQGTTRRTGDKQ